MNAHPLFAASLRQMAGVSPAVESVPQTVSGPAASKRILELEARLHSTEQEVAHLRRENRALTALRPDVLIGEFVLEVETHAATFHAPSEFGDVEADPDDVLAALNALTKKYMPELEADVLTRWKRRAGV